MILKKIFWSRFTVIVALFSVVAAIIIFYGLTPFQTWQEQKQTRSEVESQLQEIERSNQSLLAEIELLATPEEVERIARRNFNLIYPGETAYVVLPPARPDLEVPSTWPYIVLQGYLQATAPVQAE